MLDVMHSPDVALLEARVTSVSAARKAPATTSGKGEQMDDHNVPSEQGATGTGSAATTAKEKISGTVSNVKDKISEISRTAGQKIEQARESAAGALDQAAVSVLSGSEQVSGAANSVADNLGATAAYVRDADLQSVGNDVLDLVKRYPWPMIAFAAVMGFAVGRRSKW
jgi:ElaB/YqjD/DUF883 family membrane-anchored ribosome-binding protein